MIYNNQNIKIIYTSKIMGYGIWCKYTTYIIIHLHIAYTGQSFIILWFNMLDFPAFNVQHMDWRIPTAAFPPPRCNWSSEFKTKEQATNLYHRADSPWSFWPQYFKDSRLGLWDAKFPKKMVIETWPPLQFCGQTLVTLALNNSSQSYQVALEPMDLAPHLSLGLGGRPKSHANCRLKATPWTWK